MVVLAVTTILHEIDVSIFFYLTTVKGNWPSE